MAMITRTSEPSGTIPEDQPAHIRLPFLNRPVGLGDAIRKATEAVGIQPCGGCEERRKKLNQRVQFNPWST